MALNQAERLPLLYWAYHVNIRGRMPHLGGNFSIHTTARNQTQDGRKIEGIIEEKSEKLSRFNHKPNRKKK
jgi:hypothetical protein